jgi:hypothetical protein
VKRIGRKEEEWRKKGRGQRKEDGEEGWEKQRKRTGENTVRCEEDGEEGGGMEEEKGRGQRTEDKEEGL